MAHSPPFYSRWALPHDSFVIETAQQALALEHYVLDEARSKCAQAHNAPARQPLQLVPSVVERNNVRLNTLLADMLPFGRR